jgi:hypothetical protein
MRLEYENGIVRIENAEGQRWEISGDQRPQIDFEFDALVVNEERALRRLGGAIHPLTRTQVAKVASYVAAQQPPSGAAARQLKTDLKAFTYGLINNVIGQLEYDSLLDVQITGRSDSTDIFAGEARRVLAYVDTLSNALHGLSSQIDIAPKGDLKPIKHYANMLPIPPAIAHFRGSGAAAAPMAEAEAKTKTETTTPAAVQDAKPKSNGRHAPSPITVELATADTADFGNLLNRVMVFDDFYPATQLYVLEQWALQTPHWMLTNSTYNEKGEAMHRLWGASYIEAWRSHGWSGLPPVLYSAVMTAFSKLNVTITEPEYIGLNGQMRGQDASMHSDCELDSPDDLSILIYLGEDTTGDLFLYDKSDRTVRLDEVTFRPNRVIAFDGSIPHQAFAPKDEKFRMSVIIRGKYRCGAFEPADVQRSS